MLSHAGAEGRPERKLRKERMSGRDRADIGAEMRLQRLEGRHVVVTGTGQTIHQNGDAWMG
jgi:hypothetical protein